MSDRNEVKEKECDWSGEISGKGERKSIGGRDVLSGDRGGGKRILADGGRI